MSSSSCCTISTNISDPILPPFSSSIASSRSSRLHLVSAQSCCPAIARPCEGVHRCTPYMSLSLLLQQYPACLVYQTWIVFGMGGGWPYSCCFVGCCLYICLVSIHIVHPYSSIDTTAAWKKLRFILFVRSDFHMSDSLSIAVHAFASHVLMSFSVDETLLAS